jgi:serpin B
MAESARNRVGAQKVQDSPFLFGLAAALAAILIVTVCVGRSRTANAQPAPEPPAAEVSRSMNDFGLRLLRTLTDGNGRNVLVSPLSVSLALAMTYNGASGTTRTAIAKTLGIASSSYAELNRDNRELLDMIRKADPKVQIEIANALWTQSGFAIQPQFLKQTHDFYDAAAEGLNFATEPQAAADQINGWVKDRTHGKIPKIIKDVSPFTVLVLTDAVYFKGLWQVPFDKRETAPRSFHLLDGSTLSIPMMVQDGHYDYLETDALQAIRLPYGNGRFVMYVFLPRKNSGVPDFIRTLDPARWTHLVAQLRRRKGQIVLPKFESTYGQKLNDALKQMGMGVAFSSGADFSRIHPPPPQLQINDVEHKTYMKVDEEGSEAAAATSVGIVASAVMREPPPFTMVVDHPFFCAITEEQSGALLFAGVVTNPAPPR